MCFNNFLTDFREYLGFRVDSDMRQQRDIEELYELHLLQFNCL